MPGPLPKPAHQRRRTNAPVIPTTDLPASGRQGDTPDPPAWLTFGPAASAWWAWAWSTPQACAWSTGMGFEPFVARRAMLEESIAKGGEAATAMREARELDDRLGLSPKGMAALRWRVVADEPEQAENVTAIADYRQMVGA